MNIDTFRQQYRFARAYFIFWHFVDILVLSTTWNDLFCSCEHDVSIWWQMLVFVFLCPKHWFQFNSRIVRTHFPRIMTLSNYWKMIAEPQNYIFRWCSRFRRRRVCLSSLITNHRHTKSLTSWRTTMQQKNFRTKSNNLHQRKTGIKE